MSNNVCEICGKEIKVQIYRGTGACGDNCRKVRDEGQRYPEADLPESEGHISASKGTEPYPGENQQSTEAIGYSAAGAD